LLGVTGVAEIAIPETESELNGVIITADVYHPAESGARSGDAVIVGGVVSRFIVTDFVVVPPALVAEQEKVTPVVSLVTELLTQPVFELITDSGSVTVQVRVTLEMYHPLFPSVPLILGVITGPVVSGGETIALLTGAAHPGAGELAPIQLVGTGGLVPPVGSTDA
jgi:hypothetical protein